MSLTSEETPPFRAEEKQYYAINKIGGEVKNTVFYLGMASRLDEYMNLSEKEKLESKWKDFYGNVFVNAEGDVKVTDVGTFITGNMRLGDEGAKWTVNYSYAGRMTFTFARPSTWLCTLEGNSSEDCLLWAVSADKEKGVWALEYSSTEKDGDISAVFSSTGLKAIFNPDSPVELQGKVRVEFFVSGRMDDWLELDWPGGGKDPLVSSSR